MKQIRDYFKSRDITRIIRMLLAGLLTISYFNNHETLFLFGGIVIGIQAIFNIKCPGGSCGTKISTENKIIIKTEKHVPDK